MDIGKFLDENNHGGIIEESDFFTHPEMEIVENTVVEKKEPEKVTWKWRKEIAKDLMSGKHAQEIYKKWGKLITDSKYFDKIVKYIDVMDGLLGTVVVDVSVFDDKFVYENIPLKYRKYNMYAINSTDIVKQEDVSYNGGNDGTMDGFLNGNDIKDVSCRFFDRTTGLEAIDSISDINNDLMALNELAVCMTGNGVMTPKQYEGFKKSEHKLNFIKKVFRGDFRKTLNAPIENDVESFGLQQQVLEEKPGMAVKSIGVTVTEPRLNKIKVTNQKSVDLIISEDKREQLKDFKVSSGKPTVKIDEKDFLKEKKLNKVNVAGNKKSVDVIVEPDKREQLKDFKVSSKKSSVKIDENEFAKEKKLNEIKVSGKNTIDIKVKEDKRDQIKDFKVSSRNSVKIDEDEFFAQDGEDIEYDKQQDKQDISNNFEFGFYDDLDVGAENKQDIDEDEFFSQDDMDGEIEFDAKPKKQEISNNYEFGW